jgi:amidase
LNLHVASASSLARAIRARRLSARDAVEACLARIQAVEPWLHAVVRLDAEGARRAAEVADAEAARGAWRGPLHGVPITVKDSFDTAGLFTTWGTPGRARFVPDADATAVARLRAAGAIVLGKTNTPELTLGFEAWNPLHPRTANPWDARRTSGGSSGGAAALVAAGGAALEIGSDTGGSIRLPAHCCGVAGLRPTSGRVPRTGHAIGPGGAADFLTQVGPLARRVEDLTLALRLLAGPDGRDPFVAPVPLADPQAVSLAGLRVALLADNGIATPDPALAAAARAAADALAAAGARVAEQRPPGVAQTQELFPAVLLLDGGGEVRRLLERCGTPVADSSLAGLAGIPAPRAAQRLATIERWDAFRAALLAWSADWDLVVSPPNAHAALRHGESDARMPAFSYTMTWNLAGWPGAVVRAGASPEGLPIGVQLLAPPWREEVALAAAACVEAALGGFAPPPLEQARCAG